MSARKILVPLDKSDNSHRALRYCANALRGAVSDDASAMRITLFLVEFMPQKKEQETLTAWESRCHEMRTEQRQFLDDAVMLLVDEGIPRGVISSEYVTMRDECVPFEDSEWRTEVADRIVREQRQNGYDTLIMGRRTVSKTEAYLFGSVTRKVLERVRDCVVWLVC